MPSLNAPTGTNPHNSTGTYTTDTTLPSPKLEKKRRGFCKTCKKLLASARASVRRHACVEHEVDHSPIPSRFATLTSIPDLVNSRAGSSRQSLPKSVRVSGGLAVIPSPPSSGGLRAGPRVRTAQPVRDSAIYYSVHIGPEQTPIERLHPNTANGRRQGTRTAPRYAHPLVNAVILPSTLTPMSSCSDPRASTSSSRRPSLDSRSTSYGTDVDTEANSQASRHTSWTSTDVRTDALPVALQIQGQRGSRRLSPADLWNPSGTRRREREASARAFVNRMDGVAPAFPAAATDVNKPLPPLPADAAPSAPVPSAPSPPTLPHVPYAPPFASAHDFGPSAPPVNQRDFDLLRRGMLGPRVPASLLPGARNPGSTAPRPHTIAITPSSNAYGADRDAVRRPPPMGYLPFPGGAFDPFNPRGAGGTSTTTASPSNATASSLYSQGSGNDNASSTSSTSSTSRSVTSSSVTSNDDSISGGSTLPAIFEAMEEVDRLFHAEHVARVARIESAVFSPVAFNFGATVEGAQYPSRNHNTSKTEHPNPLRSHAPGVGSTAPHPYPTTVTDQIRRRTVPSITRTPATTTTTTTRSGVPSNTSTTPSTFGRNLGLAPNTNKPLPASPGPRSPRRFTYGIVPPSPFRRTLSSRPPCQHRTSAVHPSAHTQCSSGVQHRNFSLRSARFPHLDARQAARNSVAEPRYQPRTINDVEARYQRERRESRERKQRRAKRKSRIGRIGRGFGSGWCAQT